MLSVISGSDVQAWDTVIRSFENWDIYYLAEYAESFRLHGDGVPYLVYYQDSDVEICYSVMKEDLADLDSFSGWLNHGAFFDLTTPYGYGGPLVNGDLCQHSANEFKRELFEFCNDNHIVSQFLRYHPLLGNHSLLSDMFETRFIHDTIYMDLASPDIIWSNMDAKNRNMVRKAVNNGVKIERRPISDIADFIEIYNETMERDHADDYYYFSDEFFESLSSLENNSAIFYAIHEGKPVGSAIILFGDKYMHYHLSGTLSRYRTLGSNNLLLYEASLWGYSKGLEKFHLGGGLSDSDGLFSFKKKFNKNGRLPFVIGRTIFNKESYKYLKDIRSRDAMFDPNNSFFIQYRQ